MPMERNSFTDHLIDLGYQRGYKKAIEEFAERIRGYAFGATEIIDRVAKELKGE